ncbi:hypothetical protein BDE27_2482 [Xenorhabdus ehlersii]|uniref:Uncharacterized protein n=2 Tax=Xenorhabdus ehlersii TaxID=290111 RepID=A0A2D0IJT2_9GAMM|nr:hypothetical protein Xehl_04009 [Xenorhabdus ehlersii]RKE87879.1 hypothetical protein BDE27_3421 [Xenorhabdus ehlersii]RKE90604.1 hypothetical protein BDE27_2482 [Xenorhabdus ehlersii]
MVVACDTRWSVDLPLNDGKHILLVDNTGFNKITYRKGGVLVCAGDGPTIAKMKEWWFAEHLDAEALPDLEHNGYFKVSILMISSNGDRLFDAGPKKAIRNEENQLLHAIFSGSGTDHAVKFFTHCGCAKSSVEGAILLDPRTGGEVKFYELKTGKNNLDDETMNYNSIIESMISKGVLMKATDMYIANSGDAEAVDWKNHPQANDIANWLANGSVKAYAPTGGKDIEWSEEKNNKIKQAARKIAELEKTMNN